MARRVANWLPDAPAWVLAVLVFLAAFSLYGLTTADSLGGYEPETAAVTEGFVKTGDFVLIPDSPLRGGLGFRGRDGKLIGRAGVTDPLVRVPFYAAGWALDELRSDSRLYNWRRRAFWFASPFYVAVAAAFFFLTTLELTRSRRWGLVLAALFAVGSLAWPYSKIGMESVLTTALVVTLYGVVRAARSERLWPWALAGVGAGAAIADKPYGVFAIAALLAYLIPTLRAASSTDRVRRVAALGLPLMLWGVGFGLYNWTRTGSFLDTGRNSPETTLAAPFNFIGFLVSPGKGLIFYSPLVVLGALGLRAMYRQDRRLVLSICACLFAGIAVVATLRFWSDEFWGPRYIVWLAWLLLLPIPFWAITRRRKQILGGVAALAVAVQFLGVIAPSYLIAFAGSDVTGYKLFVRLAPGHPALVPYGRDPTRWIPELSPLLLQAKVVLSKASLTLGGPPITTTYHPYDSEPHVVTLDDAHLSKYGFDTAFFWWAQAGTGRIGLVGVLLFLGCGATATALLAVAGRPAGRHYPDGQWMNERSPSA